MEILKISYAPKGVVRFFSLLLSVYSMGMGIGLAIAEILAKNYHVVFYSSLVLVLFGVILLLLLLKKVSPLLVFTTDSLWVKTSDKTPIRYEWDNVKEIGIGLSSVKIITLDETAHDIDLSEIKYKDLRVFKTKVIELSENRSIPYKNDY